MKALIAILAAGQSSRLGQPKQLLKKGNHSLLSYTIEQSSTLGDVIVVTGAYENLIQKEIPDKAMSVFNKDWEKGMGTSLRLAAQYAIQNRYDKLLITPVDLPKVNRKHFQRLLQSAIASQSKITCAGYSGTYGIPSVFDHSVFENLLEIGNREGAKGVIKRYFDLAQVIPIPEAAYDIDLPGDIDSLLA